MLLRYFMLGVLLCCPATTFGWDELGHRAIGEVVQASLDDATRDTLANIIAPGQPLADGALAELSMWPDQIKDVATMPLEEQHAAHEFNAAHPFNKSWHYVNLPLKAPGYPDLPATAAKDPIRKFVRTDSETGDIVQKLTEVIQILEAPTEPRGWTKKQALAWLLHLVEDLHQPLHVGSSFYRLGRNNVPRLPMLTIPAAAAHKHVACDRGGNQLQFESPQVTLHSIWDDCLVQVEAGLSCVEHSGLPGVAPLAAKILGWLQEPMPSVSRPKGDHHEWPRRWATDSLHVADESEAYHITLTNPRTTGAVVKTLPGEPCSDKGQRILLSISAPTVMEEYVSQFRPVAALQLTKAAIRLTELLKRIQWK
jgi:hypothetical protein